MQLFFCCIEAAFLNKNSHAINHRFIAETFHQSIEFYEAFMNLQIGLNFYAYFKRFIRKEREKTFQNQRYRV